MMLEGDRRASKTSRIAVILALAASTVRALPLGPADSLATPPQPPDAVAFDPLVNDPALDATIEDTQTGAAILSLGGGRLVAAYTDSGSNVPFQNVRLTGWSTSDDGGRTFVDRGALPEGAIGITRGDLGAPALARDPASGRIFLATIGLYGAIQVFRSDDRAESWQGPASTCSGGDQDWALRPAVAIDPDGRFVYVLNRLNVWPFSGGMLFSRSTDGGGNFPCWQAQDLSSEGSGGSLAIAADGSVHAFWIEPGAPAGTIVTRVSHDHGASFEPARTVSPLRGTWEGRLWLPFAAWAYPHAVADPLDAAHLLVVFADGPEPGYPWRLADDVGDVFLVESHDSGATWSQPVRVDEDAGGRDQFSPTIAISPDGSHLFVGWYDRRRDPDNWMIEYWGRVAKLASGSPEFGPEFPISTAAFPPVYDRDLLANEMSDSDQAAADDDSFYIVWGDTRLSDAAHRNQTDVRFARIPKAGPGPLLVPAGASFVSGNCDTEDGAPDPGETVVERLCITNEGTLPTSDLVATLEPGGGVTAPGPPQDYGTIAAGGGVACRDFGFTVDPQLACGGELTPTLSLLDGGDAQGSVRFESRAGASGIARFGPFVNPTPIGMPFGGPGHPYPSTINLSGVPTSMDQVRVLLRGFSDDIPELAAFLLVGPTGVPFDFLGYAGGGEPVSDFDLTFDDEARTWIEQYAPLAPGNYRPTVYNFAAYFDPPAPYQDVRAGQPAGMYGLRSAYWGQDPNGEWSLFAEQQNGAYSSGLVEGGWGIEFEKRAFACHCWGPFFVGDFEVGDTSQWSSAIR
jgi:hypothetical protein